MKFLYSSTDGRAVIAYPVSKEQLEKSLGPMTDEEYKSLLISKMIPEGKNYIEIEDDDIPQDLTHRAAWIVYNGKIAIDCERARDKKLSIIRKKREPIFEKLDREYLNALQDQADTTDILSRRNSLRRATDFLKNLDVVNKINDEAILNSIRSSDIRPEDYE
jgi:hypothetical protein